MATAERELNAPTSPPQQPKPALSDHSSINLAPLKPLLDLQRGNRKAESTLQAALKDLFKHHTAVEKRVRNDMLSAGWQVANFIEGRQLIRPNPWQPGQWLAYTPKGSNASAKRAMNFMRFYTTNAVFKWQLSNPDIVASMGVDTEAAREASDAADLITDYYERRFFGPSITIQEAMQGLCWGTYIWRVRYDPSQHSITAYQPIVEDAPVQLGEGYGKCGDCGFSGPATSFPNPAGPTSPCPQCGGDAMVQGPATGMVPSVVGQQAVPLGDLVADLLPFPECFWDYRYRAEHSSWFIHQRRTSLTAVRRLLGNVKLNFGGTATEDLGLDIADKLAWSGTGGGGQAAADGRKRKLYEEPVVVGEYSLGPDDIADIVLKKDEETIGGIPLPAGPLINTFPNGLTVQYLNGLQVITGVYAEHHHSSVTSGVWHSKALSGTGQGLTDLVEVQKRFNTDDSQVHKFFAATATPGMLVRQEALGDEDRAEYLGDPAINIPINSQNLPENMSMRDIVAPAFQPQSVPAQFFNYVYQRLNDFAQIASHITDFTGGLPNVKNRTATGAQITQANSNALFTPPLQIKGEVRLRIAEIVVALYRRHFPVNRYFQLQGRYGRQQGRYLSAANLSTDISFEVVRDSELPRNSFTKREEYTAFMTLWGGFAGYKEARDLYPEFVVEAERIFNVKMKSESFNQAASLCQQRIQQMKGIEGLVDNPQFMLAAINPPIEQLEPAHDLKAKWLADWLDTDEGQQASQVLRTAVTILITAHFMMHGGQSRAVAFQQGEIAVAQHAPMAIGQMMMNSMAGPPPDGGGGDGEQHTAFQ